MMRTRPLVIAHRGNSSEAPENTQIAFQQAIDLGVDIIELDVNRTRDGFPVIFHGPELKQIAGIDGSIHDLTLAEARRLDVGSWKGASRGGSRTTPTEGARIMTLPEVLEWIRGKMKLAIDPKTKDIIPAMVRCIEEADMIDEVIICGCDVPTAQQVRSCNSGLAVGLDMDSEMYQLAAQGRPSEFHRRYIGQAASNHLSPLNVDYRYVTAEMVRLARLRAIPVWTWTVDQPDDMRRLIELGVDAIYTNYPRQLLEMLNRPVETSA